MHIVHPVSAPPAAWSRGRSLLARPGPASALPAGPRPRALILPPPAASRSSPAASTTFDDFVDYVNTTQQAILRASEALEGGGRVFLVDRWQRDPHDPNAGGPPSAPQCFGGALPCGLPPRLSYRNAGSLHAGEGAASPAPCRASSAARLPRCRAVPGSAVWPLQASSSVSPNVPIMTSRVRRDVRAGGRAASGEGRGQRDSGEGHAQRGARAGATRLFFVEHSYRPRPRVKALTSAETQQAQP